METMPYLAIRSAASLIVLERGFVRNYPLDAKNLWRIGRKNPETENDIDVKVNYELEVNYEHMAD